jgi:quinol monooxygenase YgiN
LASKLEVITRIVQYKVKKKKLDKVKTLLADYAETVNKTEQGVMNYKIYQDVDDPASIVHVMSFVDKNAEKTHDKSEHMKKLKKSLDSLSKGKALYFNLNQMQFVKSESKSKESETNISSHQAV